MKTTNELFTEINKSLSDFSMAVLEACITIKPNNEVDACALEIAKMMQTKILEISELRTEIAKKHEN